MSDKVVLGSPRLTKLTFSAFVLAYLEQNGFGTINVFLLERIQDLHAGANFLHLQFSPPCLCSFFFFFNR